MENAIAYGLIVVALGVALWVGYSAFATPISTSTVENTEANRAYFEQQAAAAGSECGDINDPQNIQHLSHHPDRYQECYRYIDPQKFREAVGRDINEFMR